MLKTAVLQNHKREENQQMKTIYVVIFHPGIHRSLRAKEFIA